MTTLLILLNLAGGEPAGDLRILEKDDGLGRVLSRAQTPGLRRRERGALQTPVATRLRRSRG